MSLHEVEGDLLEAEVDVIAHQCNVTSTGVSGLAYYLFRKHPEINTYSYNPQPWLFGTCKVFPVSNAPYKYVANMYSQYNPGGALADSVDSVEMRHTAFRLALKHIYDVLDAPDINSVAFPKNIGCGLGGGDWNTYRDMIVTMADQHPDIDTWIIEKK